VARIVRAILGKPQRIRGPENDGRAKLGLGPGACFTLNPAVQTAKYAEYAEGKSVESKSAFTRMVNLCFSPIRSVFAGFAYFAVPTAFSRFTAGRAPLAGCDS
jgi:hypothetical protein